MYPGTTPDIVFTFPSEINLDEITQVWVTFKSSRMNPKKFERTYDISNVVINNEEHTLSVHMSQDDTLGLMDIKVLEAQIRLLGPGKKARATNITEIPIERILKGGVIANAN